jgi:hypothetical protein
MFGSVGQSWLFAVHGQEGKFDLGHKEGRKRTKTTDKKLKHNDTYFANQHLGTQCYAPVQPVIFPKW